jgi:hypothetical protein
MPTGGIRCTWTFLEIKEGKLGINPLNRTVIERGVIFVFKSIVKRG